MSDTIILPRKWRIVLEGDTQTYKRCANPADGRDYLFNRLYSGQSVSIDGLSLWGFRFVEIQPADP